MNEVQETELREALSSLKEGEFLFLDNKHALGRWHETISSMAKRGLVKTEFLEGDQYGQLRLYKGAKL